MKLRNNLFSL